MWILIEVVVRFGSRLVGQISRDMQNEEWEHGARFEPLPRPDALDNGDHLD
jgi:hypothetical protein